MHQDAAKTNVHRFQVPCKVCLEAAIRQKEKGKLWVQGEVQSEIEQVFRFIVRREIEAPSRFQAVQTYR